MGSSDAYHSDTARIVQQEVSRRDVEEECLRDCACILLGTSQAAGRDLAELEADGVLALHEARLRNMDARVCCMSAIQISRGACADAEHASVD